MDSAIYTEFKNLNKKIDKLQNTIEDKAITKTEVNDDMLAKAPLIIVMPEDKIKTENGNWLELAFVMPEDGYYVPYYKPMDKTKCVAHPEYRRKLLNELKTGR